MALSGLGRKHLLSHGAQGKIALNNAVSDAFVSAVVWGKDIPHTELGWKKYRKVQGAIARKLGLTVEEAFSARERGVEESPEGKAA